MKSRDESLISSIHQLFSFFVFGCLVFDGGLKVLSQQIIDHQQSWVSEEGPSKGPADGR
jgi:hypothetical protein